MRQGWGRGVVRLMQRVSARTGCRQCGLEQPSGGWVSWLGGFNWGKGVGQRTVFAKEAEVVDEFVAFFFAAGVCWALLGNWSLSQPEKNQRWLDIRSGQYFSLVFCLCFPGSGLGNSQSGSAHMSKDVSFLG